MKLIKAQATNYRNILDTGLVNIGAVTCLVGKNEAGKTAFLKALEGLRSTNDEFKEYGKVENYPRRHYAEYTQRHPGEEARVILTTWELESEDTSAIEDVLGKGILTESSFTVSKTYEQTGSTWDIPIDESVVLENLEKRFSLTAEERKPIKAAPSTKEAHDILSALPQLSERQKELTAAIAKFGNYSARKCAIDILSAKMPKFMYFSHYDRMSGEISINQLNANKKANAITSGDQVFLDFLEYAGTDLDELTSTNRFEELNAKCEAAANRITDQIFEYWTQNDELQIKVVLSEGKPGDPAPFNQGPVARARVENNLHRVTVPFSERSAGFIWFFSFLVKFAQIKQQPCEFILLLDEPGLTLHGTAQLDLLRYFKEQIAPHHQIIYTTHSPFMVPADNLPCVRTVEDVVTLDARGRKQSQGTKIRADILATDPQTNFPVFGAIGFEVTQTLLIAKNTLLVEGPSDILYLQAASAALRNGGRNGLDNQWAICPSGGLDKILPFVRLFHGNSLNIAVLTDFERGQKRKLDDLMRSKILAHERIILATDIATKDEADIEDFFEPAFYVEILNACYDLKGDHILTTEKLDAADPNTKRLVKKAETYFRTLPNTYREFNHYDPAIFLMTKPNLLESKSEWVTKTLEKFEDAFTRINRFLACNTDEIL